MPSPYNRKNTQRKKLSYRDGSITVKTGYASHVPFANGGNCEKGKDYFRSKF